MGGSWQGRLVMVVAGGLAAVAAVPAVLAAFKVTTGWIVGGASVVVAGLAGVTAVWQERYKRVAQQRDDQELQIESGCMVLPDRRLPKVGQVDDPIRLGVHPAQPATVSGPVQPAVGGERVPTFIPRDFESELREQVARGGFVLLVGDSTAGKSRAAYEAMAALPDHVLIAPQDRTALPAAIARAAGTRKCVVWLDDAEKFIGSGGLTRGQVARLLGGHEHHRVILATLRAAEEDRLIDETATNQDERQSHRDAREVLELAYRIGVPRLFSQDERNRAHAREWDPRIRDALARADEYGIAEYLAAGPELMRDWENAWSPNTDPRAPSHPRAAALIAAAVDLRRAGHLSPLPRTLLEEVHEHYLARRGGARLRPEALDEAWSWATRPRRATTSLLHLTGDQHVMVFDYLLDVVQRRSHSGEYVPEQVIQAALNTCPLTDADTIAYTAYARGRYDLAEIASRGAYEARSRELGPEHPETLANRRFRANILRDLGRHTESEEEHRTVRNICAHVLGPEHPDTLWSRHGRAFALIRLQRYGEAEEELRALVGIRTALLGAEHQDTLTSRHVHAIALSGVGRLAEAEVENRSVLALWNRVLGPENQATLYSRGNLATVLRLSGRLAEAEAEAEQRATLEIRMRVLGAEHPDTLWNRSEFARVLAALGRLREAETENRHVLDAQTRVLGADHPDTLKSQKRLDSVLRSLREQRNEET